MTIDVLVAVLLALGVVAEVACALGLWLADSALDRLHFVGPATIVGPAAFAAAAWLQRGLDQVSVKATLAMLLLMLTGPLLSYVTARVLVERSRHH